MELVGQVMEHIRLHNFALSFGSVGAQIDHLASCCPCGFGVHRHLPGTGHVRSDNCNLLVSLA
jgi:hypothetical protein